MFRYLTAGESHGRGLVGILEGVPAGLAVSAGEIDADLARRQKGYGRGGRMKIEEDRAQIISGVRWGRALGSPIALLVENRDWANWQEAMSPEVMHEGSKPPVTRPRPGHADLAGALKYGHRDLRNVLERSSARETAMRVALGAVAKKLLLEFGIKVGSFVHSIGGEEMPMKPEKAFASDTELLKLFEKAEKSEVRCPDKKTTERIKALIDNSARRGDTLGGGITVFALGLPPGLGSHVQWDRKLDALLARALVSIQAIKSVEFGLGSALSRVPGSKAMDEIFYSDEEGFYRKTNRMGGLEGGISNGMPLVARIVMKPIPTLRKPLASVDIDTKEGFQAAYERSDVCAVPAAGVVAEAMTALALAEAFLEKFGGDGIEETRRNHDSYRKQLSQF